MEESGMIPKLSDRLLVSHEIPKSLFEKSLTFNDFDYCLVHLCKKDEQYLQFYIDEIKRGRMVYLDNSAFELGASVGTDFLLKYAQIINPTCIIAPDSLRNGKQTITNFENFLVDVDRVGLKSRIIAVAQGENEEDFFKCYSHFANHSRVDVIAIPYDIVFYDDHISKNLNKTLRYVVARKTLINRLIRSGYVNRDKRHHLLGCSSPIEFKSYQNKSEYDFIYSIDTSCPIICTMFGDKLHEEFGLPRCGNKRPNLLADNIEYQFDFSNKKTLELLEGNLLMFKQFTAQEFSNSPVQAISDKFKFTGHCKILTPGNAGKTVKKNSAKEGEVREWSGYKYIKVGSNWVSYNKYLKQKGSNV